MLSHVDQMTTLVDYRVCSVHVLNNLSTLALLAAAEVSQRGVTGSWEGSREARHSRDQEPPGQIPHPGSQVELTSPAYGSQLGASFIPQSLSKGVGAAGLKRVL